MQLNGATWLLSVEEIEIQTELFQLHVKMLQKLALSVWNAAVMLWLSLSGAALTQCELLVCRGDFELWIRPERNYDMKVCVKADGDERCFVTFDFPPLCSHQILLCFFLRNISPCILKHHTRIVPLWCSALITAGASLYLCRMFRMTFSRDPRE